MISAGDAVSSRRLYSANCSKSGALAAGAGDAAAVAALTPGASTARFRGAEASAAGDVSGAGSADMTRINMARSNPKLRQCYECYSPKSTIAFSPNGIDAFRSNSSLCDDCAGARLAAMEFVTSHWLLNNLQVCLTTAAG
jgi:hypothetical protein